MEVKGRQYELHKVAKPSQYPFLWWHVSCLVWKSETVSNKVCIRSKQITQCSVQRWIYLYVRTSLSFHVVAAVADRTADLIFTRPKGQSACCTLILITGSSLRVNKGIQISSSSGSLLDRIISRGGGRNERDRHREKPRVREREAYARPCIVLFQLAAASRRWMDPNSCGCRGERTLPADSLGPIMLRAVAHAQRTLAQMAKY